jgi:hypothetical protein
MAAPRIDLALVLAIDGSASVQYDQFQLIATGTARALRDPGVVKGLLAGPAGASMLSLMLWSGAGAQEVVEPWTRVASEADVLGFADAVDNMSRSVRAGTTAIGEALLASLTLLANLPAVAARSVVDVAGDGRSNDGIPPAPIRDRMAAADIAVNGLCVLHEEADLLEYYGSEVIGGPGAFAVSCATYGDFEEAMRRKLLREVEAPLA